LFGSVSRIVVTSTSGVDGCTVLRHATFPVGYVYPTERGKDDSMQNERTSL